MPLGPDPTPRAEINSKIMYVLITLVDPKKLLSDISLFAIKKA